MSKRTATGNASWLERFRNRGRAQAQARTLAAAVATPSLDKIAMEKMAVEVETKGPVVINPHSDWLQALINQPIEQAMSKHRLPTPENLQMEMATCRTESWLPNGTKWRCGRYRPFPGALVGSILPFLPKFQGQDPRIPPRYSRLILHELPESGHGPSWSHAQMLHPQLSEKLGSVQYAWESQCDRCEGSEVIPELIKLQSESNALVARGEPSIFDPSRCRNCHTRREGARIEGSVGFQGALPVGSIVYFEIDPERDYGYEKGLPTRRWVYFGDLDMRNMMEGKYLWSALCPDCFERHWRGVMAPRSLPDIVEG